MRITKTVDVVFLTINPLTNECICVYDTEQLAMASFEVRKLGFSVHKHQVIKH